MNKFYFYDSEGRSFATCFGNQAAESIIHECAYLASIGETPYYALSDSGKKSLMYIDRFYIECEKKCVCFEIKPNTMCSVPKGIQKALSAFNHVAGLWIYKGVKK